jgi:murein L,D-transpeptidase YafK
METAMQKQANRRGNLAGARLTAMALAPILVGGCIHEPPNFVPETPPAERTAPRAPSLETALEELSIPKEGLSIVVSKTYRWLAVYRDGEVIHRYRVGLGFRPQGAKRWEGDGRTPEGRYVVAMKNPRSRYFLSLGLNYPTPDDAARGYREGRIDWEEYRAIKFAFNDGKVPPWNTDLGGEIFIHGHGGGRDWTKGCIALDDADMRELYDLVNIGTPVTILP